MSFGHVRKRKEPNMCKGAYLLGEILKDDDDDDGTIIVHFLVGSTLLIRIKFNLIQLISCDY